MDGLYREVISDNVAGARAGDADCWWGLASVHFNALVLAAFVVYKEIGGPLQQEDAHLALAELLGEDEADSMRAETVAHMAAYIGVDPVELLYYVHLHQVGRDADRYRDLLEGLAAGPQLPPSMRDERLQRIVGTFAAVTGRATGLMEGAGTVDARLVEKVGALHQAARDFVVSVGSGDQGALRALDEAWARIPQP